MTEIRITIDSKNNENDYLKEQLGKIVNLHKCADGREVITMSYVFEEYDKELFDFLKNMYHLEAEEDNGKADNC